MLIILQPGGLSTKQAHDYVGGLGVFEDLLKHHPDIVKPFRTLERGDRFYRRECLDQAMLFAENMGTLVFKNHPSTTILERKGRSFKPTKFTAKA